LEGLTFKGKISIVPSRHVVKSYVENGYYHVYNRGVEKRNIFKDTQDHKVFLGYIKEYLTEPPDPSKQKTIFILQGETFKGIKRQPRNYNGKVELLAYCLMPNHFHLLIKQYSSDNMQDFIRSLCTRYSMYFNKKYDRVGSLFQGPYKGVLINNDNYLLHLSRYIHLNPSEYTDDLEGAYSSYADYLRIRNTSWVKPDFILKFFENQTIPEIEKFNSYKIFVENYKKDSAKILGRITLEE
jgi:putative transposase